MEEGQPRNNRGFCGQRGGAEIIQHDLLDIGRHIAMRDDYARSRAGRTRGVLQIGGPGTGLVGGVQLASLIEVEQIDLDDCRCRTPALAGGVLVDVSDRRGVRQQHNGHAVLEGRGDTLVMHTELRHRQRNGDEAGLQCAIKRDDVVQALRSKNARPIAGRAVQTQFICQDQHLAVKFPPGQRLSWSGAGHLRIHEDERGGIRLFGGATQEQGGQGHIGLQHADQPLRFRCAGPLAATLDRVVRRLQRPPGAGREPKIFARALDRVLAAPPNYQLSVILTRRGGKIERQEVVQSTLSELAESQFRQVLFWLYIASELDIKGKNTARTGSIQRARSLAQQTITGTYLRSQLNLRLGVVRRLSPRAPRLDPLLHPLG